MVVTPPGRVHLVNTTGVIPQDEYVFLNYWSQIIMNPTPGVNALAGWQSLIQYMNVGRTHGGASPRAAVQRHRPGCSCRRTRLSAQPCAKLCQIG